MCLIIRDSILYIKSQDSKLIGMCGSYVDDSSNGGKPEFERQTMSTLQRFVSKRRMYDSFHFYGARARTIKLGSMEKAQQYYLEIV